jgi:hypothetical protein
MNPNDSKTIDELTITAIQARESINSDDFDYEIAWKVESKDWKILLVGHRISSKLAQKVGEVDIAILLVSAQSETSLRLMKNHFPTITRIFLYIFLVKLGK